MNPTTLTALKASIEHWKRMRDSDTTDEAPYWDDCALCGLFIRDDCMGCPVQEATHLISCRGSPYNTAGVAWRRYYMDGETDQEYRKALKKVWCEAAQKEIDFLESLIPLFKEQLKNSIALEQSKKEPSLLS